MTVMTIQNISNRARLPEETLRSTMLSTQKTRGTSSWPL